METEIWPRLIAEAKRSGSQVAIVNGRLSEKSFRRYSKAGSFVRRVLAHIDLALMQGEKDAGRIRSLGIDAWKTRVTGNIKFDISKDSNESDLTEYFRKRFGVNGEKALVAAASTHEPEEKLIIDALGDAIGMKARLVVVPRHPHRFNDVANLLANCGHSFARRSANESEGDKSADIILLDSIGELRAIYPLADIVLVGGSFIPHGGQNILEPAAHAKAIITGPFTDNFADAVKLFLSRKALIQIPEASHIARLSEAFSDLLNNDELRRELGFNASAVIDSNRGACARTIELIFEITDG
jgi:3-deoxy-D-manno-octulosonic-acid transferase